MGPEVTEHTGFLEFTLPCHSDQEVVGGGRHTLQRLWLLILHQEKNNIVPAVFLVSQGCAGVSALCVLFPLECGTSNSPQSLLPQPLFTDISDVAVSLLCDLSAVWVNADKMTQCKYEV